MTRRPAVTIDRARRKHRALSGGELPPIRQPVAIDGLDQGGERLNLLLVVAHAREEIKGPERLGRPPTFFFVGHWNRPAAIVEGRPG